MLDLLFDALKDSLNMVPLLLIIYIGIELIEYKWGNKIQGYIQKSGKAGPFIGSVGGSLPQCGFSVIATTLYTQRLITIGTLLAVYLSTSDEAIPVILSQPDKVPLIVPIIITKIIIGLVAGYFIDLVFRKTNKKVLGHIESYENNHDTCHHEDEHKQAIDNALGCCNNILHQENSRFDVRKVLWHPITHTFKVFAYILSITVLINLIIFYIGEDSLKNLFSSQEYLQPFVAALIGLIPNCASSVAITEMYLNSTITYGAVIAGLSASGGLGILVLFKENKNKKDAIKIIAILYGISVAVGLILQLFNISPMM